MGDKSKLQQTSGPQKHAVSHPPSLPVLVVGAREECDQRILDLCEGGFLTLLFDPTHKHPAWTPRAGVYVPPDSEVDSFEEDGQINPGGVYRDGNRYIVEHGRGRLKKCAIINARRSEAGGKHTESFLYSFIVAEKGTTEDDVFSRSIGENFDRQDELPTHIGMLIRKARTQFGWDTEKCSRRFHLSDTMMNIYVATLDCAEDVRPLVDSGAISVRAAGLLLSKLPRAEQLLTVKRIHALGAAYKRGALFEEALRRSIEGKPITEPGDMPAAPPSDPGSDDSRPEDGGKRSGATGANKGTADTGGNKGGKAREDAAATRLRAPTRRVLEKWVDALKPRAAAEPPKLKALPKETKDAVTAAIEAAFYDGARLMAMRFQGKTPPGWGRLRDVLEQQPEEL